MISSSPGNNGCGQMCGVGDGYYHSAFLKLVARVLVFAALVNVAHGADAGVEGLTLGQTVGGGACGQQQEEEAYPQLLPKGREKVCNSEI